MATLEQWLSSLQLGPAALFKAGGTPSEERTPKQEPGDGKTDAEPRSDAGDDDDGTSTRKEPIEQGGGTKSEEEPKDAGGSLEQGGGTPLEVVSNDVGLRSSDGFSGANPRAGFDGAPGEGGEGELVVSEPPEVVSPGGEVTKPSEVGRAEETGNDADPTGIQVLAAESGDATPSVEGKDPPLVDRDTNGIDSEINLDEAGVSDPTTAVESRDALPNKSDSFSFPQLSGAATTGATDPEVNGTPVAHSDSEPPSGSPPDAALESVPGPIQVSEAPESSDPIDGNNLTLAELISQTKACVYQPMEFFVAWHGVLTIAYTGIPPSIIDLKEKIHSQYSFLAQENPGSKWPKTSLACLKDGKRLTFEQLQILRNICSEASFPLIISPSIVVDNLSIVLYENACLEKLVLKQTFPLLQPLDESPPSKDEISSVRKIVNEFDRKNLSAYWFHASKDGNTSSHYRNSKLGSTIVHFLQNSIPLVVSNFKEKVEKELPGMYDWFDPNQLHITIRAIS